MIADLQSISYFGNTLLDYVIALSILILGGVVVLWIFKTFVLFAFTPIRHQHHGDLGRFCGLADRVLHDSAGVSGGLSTWRPRL